MQLILIVIVYKLYGIHNGSWIKFVFDTQNEKLTKKRKVTKQQHKQKKTNKKNKQKENIENIQNITSQRPKLVTFLK